MEPVKLRVGLRKEGLYVAEGDPVLELVAICESSWMAVRAAWIAVIICLLTVCGLGGMVQQFGTIIPFSC